MPEQLLFDLAQNGWKRVRKCRTVGHAANLGGRLLGCCGRSRSVGIALSLLSKTELLELRHTLGSVFRVSGLPAVALGKARATRATAERR